MARASRVGFLESWRKGKYRGYLNVAAITRCEGRGDEWPDDTPDSDDPFYPDDPTVVWVDGKRWVVSARELNKVAYFQ